MELVVFSPTRYRSTVKDYHRMAEAEVFDPEEPDLVLEVADIVG